MCYRTHTQHCDHAVLCSISYPLLKFETKFSTCHVIIIAFNYTQSFAYTKFFYNFIHFQKVINLSTKYTLVFLNNVLRCIYLINVSENTHPISSRHFNSRSMRFGWLVGMRYLTANNFRFVGATFS